MIDNEPSENYFQQKYMMEVVDPEVFRRKKILNNHRKLYEPIRKDELVRPKINYKELHERLHEERLKILQEVKEAQKVQIGPSHIGLSKNMRRIKQREQRMKLKEDRKKEKIRVLKKKQHQYGEYIHEFYLPRIPSKYFLISSRKKGTICKREFQSESKDSSLQWTGFEKQCETGSSFFRV